jgi:hypothetical protein
MKSLLTLASVALASTALYAADLPDLGGDAPGLHASQAPSTLPLGSPVELGSLDVAAEGEATAAPAPAPASPQIQKIDPLGSLAHLLNPISESAPAPAPASQAAPTMPAPDAPAAVSDNWWGGVAQAPVVEHRYTGPEIVAIADAHQQATGEKLLTDEQRAALLSAPPPALGAPVVWGSGPFLSMFNSRM